MGEQVNCVQECSNTDDLYTPAVMCRNILDLFLGENHHTMCSVGKASPFFQIRITIMLYTSSLICLYTVHGFSTGLKCEWI